MGHQMSCYILSILPPHVLSRARTTDQSEVLNVCSVLAQLPPKISMVYISLQGDSYILMNQHVASGEREKGANVFPIRPLRAES